MVFKTALFVYRGDFWKFFFLFHEVFKFFSCFQTLRNYFQIFGENNLVGLSKVFSIVQGFFLEELFFKNKFFELFLYFWISGIFLFGLSAKTFRQLWQNCILCVQWRFLIGLSFIEKIYEFSYCLRAVRKIFWHFGGAEASKRLSKLQYMSIKKISRKFDFWRKNFHSFFRVLIKNFADFCQKIFSNRKTFSEVIFFLGKTSCHRPEVEGESFWCSVRTFGMFVKTALYVSEWDFWLNCFIFEFFEFFTVFRLWEEHSATLAQKL